MLYINDGTQVTTHAEIENEILEYYGELIDIVSMREGAQWTMEQRNNLIVLVNEKEILKTLNGIGDLKVFGIYGFGAKIFKASWNMIKDDRIATILEFFNNERLYKAFNNTLVTLIPNSVEAKNIREYRPIAGCTTFYKIISKILTVRL